MALAANANLPILEGAYADHPVKGSTRIYEGAVVSINADGYALGYAGTDTLFAGFADRQADNSGGVDGAIKVRVRRDVHFRQVTLAGAVQADVGSAIYANDDGTFTLDATYDVGEDTFNNLQVGTIHSLAGVDTVIVRVAPNV
jgi:hypothetical protein